MQRIEQIEKVLKLPFSPPAGIKQQHRDRKQAIDLNIPQRIGKHGKPHAKGGNMNGLAVISALR